MSPKSWNACIKKKKKKKEKRKEKENANAVGETPIQTHTKCEGKDIALEDELDEVAELPLPKKAKTKSKNKTNYKDNKRRRTSTIWCYFQMLPTKDEEKPTCKCKKCGKEYIVVEAYGIGNLNRHLELCPRKFEAPLSIPVSTVVDIGNVFFIYILVEWVLSFMMIF